MKHPHIPFLGETVFVDKASQMARLSRHGDPKYLRGACSSSEDIHGPQRHSQMAWRCMYYMASMASMELCNTHSHPLHRLGGRTRNCL